MVIIHDQKLKIEQINTFIKKKLKKQIQSDLKVTKTRLPKITNESDLEGSIYFWLRKEIGKKEKNLKISTNYTVKGYQKKRGGDETFIEPDVVILQWVSDFEQPEIKIALELKIRGPSKSLESGKETFETYFSKIKKDFRKLNTTIKKGWIDTGYFIFVYQSSKLNEKQIEKILVKTLDGKLEFHPIIINKFKVTKKKDTTKSMLISQTKSEQLYSWRPKTDDHRLWRKCEYCHQLEEAHTDKMYIRHQKKLEPSKPKKAKSRKKDKH